MCGATQVADLSLDGVDVVKSAIVQGVVTRDGEPVAGGYVRLLDASGEFTAEVVTSATGAFRFFARPGTWTVRALAAAGASGQTEVVADFGLVVDASVEVG
jgi:hypothetical protein